MEHGKFQGVGQGKYIAVRPVLLLAHIQHYCQSLGWDVIMLGIPENLLVCAKEQVVSQSHGLPATVKHKQIFL